MPALPNPGEGKQDKDARPRHVKGRAAGGANYGSCWSHGCKPAWGLGHSVGGKGGPATGLW